MLCIDCTNKLATRRSVSLPVGDNLADTFRLIQEQAISTAHREPLDAVTSDEGPSTLTAGESISDLSLPGDSLQEVSILPRHDSSAYTASCRNKPLFSVICPGPDTPTASAGKSISDLTFPEDSLQELSSLPRHYSRAYPTYTLPEMASDTYSGISMIGKSLQQWDSKGGVHFLLWERDARSHLAPLRIIDGDTCIDGSLEIEVLLGSVAPRSPASEDMRRIRRELNEALMLADLGWFLPARVPAALMKFAKSRISAQVNLTGYAQHLVDEWLTPVYNAARQQTIALKDDTEIRVVLQHDYTPTSYQEHRRLQEKQLMVQAATKALKDAQAAKQKDTTADKTKPYPAEVAAQQELATANAMDVTSSIDLAKFVRVEGIKHTPHTMVMDIFWIAMRLLYAISPESEPQFYALASPGAQKQATIRSFAADVKLHYQAVQFLPGVTEQMVPYVFANGLDQAATREYIRGRLHEDELLSLDALIDDAEQYERGASMFELIDRSRGIITGSSSQTTAGGEAHTAEATLSSQMEQLDLGTHLA